MGLFITFEGIEGCGKTTQIARLATALREQGLDVVETREPGGCAIADQIRAVLLDADNHAMVAETELLLYAAARAQHIAQVVKPALEQDKIVLCDRFCDATLAYQGHGRRLDVTMIDQLNSYACQGITPDKTLLLDLAVAVGLGRARQRNASHHSQQGVNEDRFEQESLLFHQRIRQGYLTLAKQHPQRIITIDASGDCDSVSQRIMEATRPIFQQREFVMTFANIIGHEQQKKLLRQAWTNQRPAHAYLFTGAEGVGKRLMALALVRLIFCDQQTGCGSCAGCRRVDHNNHPDLHIIEPDGSAIKIDAIRQLQKDLAHPPLEARRRICIIDDADLLNPAAGNALLKTLEEPRAEVMLILISAHPEQVLQTIRSRCQQLPFARLEQRMIAKVLQKQQLEDTESQVLAALSEGSLKKALGSDREFYIEQRKEVFKALLALTPGSIVPMLSLAEKWANDKEQLDDLIDLLLSGYRDIFLLVNQGSQSLLTNIDLKPRLQQQAAKETSLSVQRKLEAIFACQNHLRRNVNRQLAMERLLIQLTQSPAPLPA